MNMYQVKMKIGEFNDTTKVYDVLANTVVEAVKKAVAENTEKISPQETLDEPYRVVTVSEKARNVLS